MEVETKIKKAKSRLMRHPESRYMAGIFVSGKTEVCDDIPTACTDGWNEKYGREFMDKLTVPEATGVVWHEGMHKYLKHLLRFKKQMKTDGRLMNAAMDYAVNAIIHNVKDKTLAVLPEPHLYHPMFENWSVLEIYEYLKTGRDADGNKRGEPKDNPANGNRDIGGNSYPTGSLDNHSEEMMDGEGGADGEMTDEKVKEISQKIDDAIQQGMIIAGAMGVELPRAITETLEIPVNWPEELYEFATSMASGADEYTMRRYNRRRLADDIYMPTMYSDSVSEVLLLLDASGSINQKMLNEWAGVVSDVCVSVQPDLVRVLWWDTKVHTEQVFDSTQFDQIAKLLMPRGGGGTRVSCVSEYIKEKDLNADCAIVLTDGYVEPEVRWETDIPTLWMVTENRSFNPPAGRMVKIDSLGEV